jgi:hypothetical protein
VLVGVSVIVGGSVGEAMLRGVGLGRRVGGGWGVMISTGASSVGAGAKLWQAAPRISRASSRKRFRKAACVDKSDLFVVKRAVKCPEGTGSRRPHFSIY